MLEVNNIDSFLGTPVLTAARVAASKSGTARADNTGALLQRSLKSLQWVEVIWV